MVLQVRSPKSVHWAKIKAEAFLLEALGKNLFPCVLQLRGAAYIPQLVAPFHLQSRDGGWGLSHVVSF